MKRIDFVSLLQKLQQFGPSLAGVFTYSDLMNLMGAPSELQGKRTLRRLVREGALFKVQRGFYVTADADPWVLACQLKKGACISMDSVLARNGLIGTIPARTVSAVYPGQGRKAIETPLGSIRYYSIKKELLFGSTRLKNGVVAADSEKAYLDMLYYYVKGARFVVDPLADVSLWRLDLKKLRKYLKAYRNPKFVKFVEGQIREVS